MEEFLKSYGFLILMLVICVGSHFFMGHGGHKGHEGHRDKKDEWWPAGIILKGINAKENN